MKIDVVPVHENFKGLSYGEWAAIWATWLMSEDPDRTARTDILFLRGNINYRPVNNIADGPRFLNTADYLDKTGKNGEIIDTYMAILIPVLTAQYSVGMVYEGKKIVSEHELRDAVNKDTDQSEMTWATIGKKGSRKGSRIVRDISNYRVESPFFKLSIPPSSKFNPRTEDHLKPGSYEAVVGGYFIIIQSLPLGKFQIRFGGRGRGGYGTDSLYDIEVRKRKRIIPKDMSGQNLSKVKPTL